MRPWLLRLHRWTTLVFALPLLVVIGTGLILSFEPMAVQNAQQPGSLKLEAVQALLDRHDPQGKATGLVHRATDGLLSIRGVGEDGSIDVALKTGAEVDEDSWLTWLFSEARPLHEHFIGDLRWLVTASTIAMLVLIALGLLMGLPRLRNSVSGWHQATAWFLLPLVILSPLTGLAIAFGVTFTSPPVRGQRAAPIPIKEAVRLVAEKHDLSTLIWIRSRGGRLLARINESGEWRVYAVTREGLQPTARNWPRLIHEGNWAGHLSGAINVVTSLALLLLLGTGLTIWLRRRLRKRTRTRPALAPAE